MADAPPCRGTLSKTTVASGLGVLESIVIGGGGKAYISLSPTPDDIATGSRLIRIDRPGAPPVVLTEGDGGMGGLAWDGNRLLWGVTRDAATGDTNPVSKIYRVDADTGSKTLVSDTLGMANGIARSPDGTIYASNNFGTRIDRILPNGTVLNGWASVPSPNGLALSRNGRYLFAARTTFPGEIKQIDVSDPTKVTTRFSADGLVPGNPILDGLITPKAGTFYVAAWAEQEAWKVDSAGRACAVASGLDRPSSLALVNGRKGFADGALYVVDFGGTLTRVTGVGNATSPG